MGIHISTRDSSLENFSSDSNKLTGEWIGGSKNDTAKDLNQREDFKQCNPVGSAVGEVGEPRITPLQLYA